MNTHTTAHNTNLVSIEDLLAQQLDALNGLHKQAEAGGPPGVLVADLISEPASEPESSSVLHNGGMGDLPFLNLDPYDLTGKDNLPDFEISSPDPDYINWEVGGASGTQFEYDVSVSNATLRSDDARIYLENLSETRMTEVQSSRFNGQDVVVEWKNEIAHEVSGSFDDLSNGALWVDAHVEMSEGVQAERFTLDKDGNIVQDLSAYDWGFGMGLSGDGQAFGIKSFDMNLTVDVSIQWDAELGVYIAAVSVDFDYVIEMLDGRKFEDEAFMDEEGFYSSLDFFNFEFGNDVTDKLGAFKRDMGDAWDALSSFNDHMEALLIKLREEGYYDYYDFAEGGIENPFDFKLPSIDPFA